MNLSFTEVLELITRLGLPTLGLIYLGKLYLDKGKEVIALTTKVSKSLEDNLVCRENLIHSIEKLLDHVEKESILRQDFMLKLASKLLDSQEK